MCYFKHDLNLLIKVGEKLKMWFYNISIQTTHSVKGKEYVLLRAAALKILGED